MAPVLTPTSAATPKAAAPPAPPESSALLDALAKLPLPFKEKGVWFGDRARALESAGASHPRSLEEARSLDQGDLEQSNQATEGIVLAPGLLASARGEEWEQLFGFTRWNVELALSTGRATTDPPFYSVYLEGNLDQDLIRRKLLDLGYQEREAPEGGYYAIREDRQGPGLGDPTGAAQSNMNRIFLDDGVLIVAPETGLLTGMLSARAGTAPSLAGDAGFSAAARALGDPLSAVLLTRQAFLETRDSLGRDALEQYEPPSSWGSLNRWDVMGVGLVRGEEGRWLVFSLYYTDPDAAELDAPRLLQRMSDYPTAHPLLAQRGFPERPIDQSCGLLTHQARKDGAGSTLTVRCQLTENPATWWLLVDFRDLAFLLPSAPEPPQEDRSRNCSEREEGPPCGPGVEIGKSYSYTLYTHCGIRSAYFDGRRWIADPILDDVNPPPGWGNPLDQGGMELVTEDLARFTSSAGLTAEFRPLPEGSEYPWGPCL